MGEKQYLADKELKFAQLVAEGVPRSRAIIEAGYSPSPKNAAIMGSAYAKKPHIQQKIEELRKAQGRKLMESLPDLLKEMLKLALGGKDAEKTPGYNARVQFEALRDLLDRIPGMGKKEKIQVSDEEFPAELLRLLNRLNADEGEA
jgi:phage terminase small subunit